MELKSKFILSSFLYRALHYWIFLLYDVICIFTLNVNNMLVCNIILFLSHLVRLLYTLHCKLNLKQPCGTLITTENLYERALTRIGGGRVVRNEFRGCMYLRYAELHPCVGQKMSEGKKRGRGGEGRGYRIDNGLSRVRAR